MRGLGERPLQLDGHWGIREVCQGWDLNIDMTLEVKLDMASRLGE